MPHALIPRILFIDAYDSFSNNIISLIELNLNVRVTIIKIDEPIENFPKFLKSFQGVIAGPGPGHPGNPADVGLFNELWKLRGDDILPVLGICLGFQSLVLAFGGKIERLPEPRHGILRKIHSEGESIFKGISNIETIQYHSLHASLGNCCTKNLHEDNGPEGLPKPKGVCSGLKPLAWDLEDENPELSRESREFRNPAAILMAVEHTRRPFYGIQFHPESVCSNGNAQKIIMAWWNLVRKWRPFMTQIAPMPSGGIIGHRFKKTQTGFHFSQSTRDMLLASLTRPSLTSMRNNYKVHGHLLEKPDFLCSRNLRSIPLRVISTPLSNVDLDIPSIFENLKLKNSEVILLDSALHQRPEIGTHSIIGIITADSVRLEYNCGTSNVRRIRNGKVDLLSLQSHGGTIFSYLKYFMQTHKAIDGSKEIPFWGGLMGYITYEACLETIDLHKNTSSDPYGLRNPQKPDLSFVFVERSIVIDHRQQKLHVQSIKPSDEKWVNETASILVQKNSPLKKPLPSFILAAHIKSPNKTIYKTKIRACQNSIRAGDAYELCLTTKSTIKPSRKLPSWPLYLRLRNLNPSPFSAYLKLGSLTLLSSSPERFLSWSRLARKSSHSAILGENGFKKTNQPISTCQFRPIKGTVKRIPTDPNSPPITLAQATALLSTPKERAENLMIADLIRHDLHGVVGSGNVHVSKLMVVEEYATLYQLVTVIEGTLQASDEEIDDEETYQPQITTENQTQLNAQTPPTQIPHNTKKSITGIDVLAASLPPGSMTGAPKQRACTILHELEGRPRGIYSGVLGYLDVGGGGDFSVIIRSAFRWDPAANNNNNNNNNSSKPDSPDCGASSTHSSRSRSRGSEGNSDSGSSRGEDDSGDGPDGGEWTVGAGGAVTCLSTEEGEWEEMMAKMKSTIGVFDGEGGCGGVE